MSLHSLLYKPDFLICTRTTAVLPGVVTISVAITDLSETINDMEESIRIITTFWVV